MCPSAKKISKPNSDFVEIETEFYQNVFSRVIYGKGIKMFAVGISRNLDDFNEIKNSIRSINFRSELLFTINKKPNCNVL